LKLAEKVNLACQRLNKCQRVYIQINSGNDPAKYGFKMHDVLDAAQEINNCSNLSLEGVMMIPPFIAMDNYYRSIFQQTKEMQLNIYNSGISSCINVSMGMSRDYQLAIEEGATHIRIGTALFGSRH
tara:strand:- start:3969 stop:4349 length:381 start_codon:yes stop_codon:yes gene_type:complete